MRTIERFVWSLCLALAFTLAGAIPASAQERLCDPAAEDCRAPLWNLIDKETVGIDVAFWFMQDASYVTKLIARHRAGVRVRVLVDPRANPIYAGNGQILEQLRAAGIPMRYKLDDGILHWKMMLFAGQNKLEFSGANYNPFFFVPAQPYVDYIDEAIYFTDDPALVDSFKTKFDDLWANTTRYGNYANIAGPLARAYPRRPIDPALNFPPGPSSQDFRNRTVDHLNQEAQRIDVIMYRITNQSFTDAITEAVKRGVPVRLLHEPEEYRNPERPWDAYNVDLLYTAGVQLKMRKHRGLNHEKVVMLYGQGLTIFGSSNWTGPSANSQEEHNYFTTKPWFFSWFVSHFERKWNSAAETETFVPLPPDAPRYQSPANGLTNQPRTMTLAWEGGPWAHQFDIYFGTSPNPPLVAAGRLIGRVDNTVPETYMLPALQPGTRYYWRIAGKTMANVAAVGPVWSFTTQGTPPILTPAPTSVSPGRGSTNGGTAVTVSGTGFAPGLTVRFGGTLASNIQVLDGNTITATTPPHSAGIVDVIVTNPEGRAGTLREGFTYKNPGRTRTGRRRSSRIRP